MKRLRSYMNNVSKWWGTMHSYHEYPDQSFPRVLHTSFKIKTALNVGVVGSIAKALLTLGNSVKIYNRDKFLHYIHNRPPTTPLITLCNHSSMIDEPFLISKLLDYSGLCNATKLRWCLGAREILFTNYLTTWMMTHAKVIPIVRGEGVHQPGMRFAIEQLNKGDWVQIFPEAKVTLEPLRFKWGIGQLIANCINEPIVLPFWHSGMEDVYPTIKPYYPRFFKKVTVLFGEPISCDVILKKCRDEGLCEIMTRKMLTDLVQDSLYKLKVEGERLHALRFS